MKNFQGMHNDCSVRERVILFFRFRRMQRVKNKQRHSKSFPDRLQRNIQIDKCINLSQQKTMSEN